MEAMSYMKIRSSVTTSSRVRFIFKAAIRVGKVSSHIVDCRRVLIMRSRRGDKTRATRGEEKSVSRIEMSPDEPFSVWGV